MDGLWWKTLLKLMIWGYHYFWKHPYGFSTRMIMLAQFSQDSPYLNPPFLSVFSSLKNPFFFGMFDQGVGGDLQQKAPRRLCSRKWHQRLLPPAKTEDQFWKFQRKTQTTWSNKEVVLKRTNKEIHDTLPYLHPCAAPEIQYVAKKNMVKGMWFTTCWKKWQLEHAAKIHPNTLDIPVCSMGTYPQTFPQHEPRIRDIGKRSCAWRHCGSGLLHKNHCGPCS